VLKGYGVRNDNTQKIVGVAGHKITFHDLRKARHSRLESIEHRLGPDSLPASTTLPTAILTERDLAGVADIDDEIDRVVNRLLAAR
jgi:hypothetical protein